MKHLTILAAVAGAIALTAGAADAPKAAAPAKPAAKAAAKAPAAPTWRQRFNEAVKLVRAKKGAEAIPLFEALAKEAADPKGRDEARGRLLGLYSGEKEKAYRDELYKDASLTTGLRLRVLDSLAGDVQARWGSTYVTEYYSYYRDSCSDAERARIRADYLKYLNEAVALVPSNGTYRIKLGDAYLYQEMFDKAREQYAFAAALPRGKGRGDDQAAYLGLFGVAECQFATGDRKGALATLESIEEQKLQLQWNPRDSFAAPPVHWAAKFLRGEYLDNLKLPARNEAKAFPHPQRAAYKETFTPLTAVALDLTGLKEDDARIKLLKTRLDWIGVPLAKKGAAPFTLKIEWTKDAACADDAGALAKPEGYTLDVDAKGACVKARTAAGATWGVVSFLQMIDYAGKRVRQGSLRDWPVTKNRGMLGRWFFETTEFSLFQKMNAICHMRNPAGWHAWTPLRDYVVLEMGRQLKEFGLELMIGIQWATQYPHLPIDSPRSAAFLTEVCAHYAKHGIGVYFPYDDSRYSDNPKEDVEKYKNQFWQCDAGFVNKVFHAVRKDYPDFHMIFCPPFYWGPDSGHSYPEDREKYLDSLKQLDPAIGLYWTGSMVKGISKEKYQVDWFTNLTGHRCTIFQNGTGPHNLLEYSIDPVDWVGWHYKGFFTDVDGFQRNTDGSGGNDSLNASLADALWNPDGFNAETAIRDGFNQLAGDGACEALKPGLAGLAYFDKYRYGKLTPDILSENLADLQAKYACATACWAKAVAQCPRVQGYGGGYARGIGYAKRVIDGAKKPPDFMKQYAADQARTEEQAKRDAGYDRSKGDILVTPLGMSGCKIYVDKGNPNTGAIKENHFDKILRGSHTQNRAFSFHFECDPFPPTGAYEMHVCGRDDELEAENLIRVSVNGKKVYEGKPGFTTKDYKVCKLVLPFEPLLRQNTVTVENLTDGYNEAGSPWLMVNYIVLKKTSGTK